MKRLLPILAIVACTHFAGTAGAAVTCDVNEDWEVLAIGSLVIQGVEYDVSFDGAFGQTIFLGDPVGADAARDAICTFLNNVTAIYQVGVFTFPLLANDKQRYFEVVSEMLPPDHPVTPDLRTYEYGVLAAGWGGTTGSSVGPNPFMGVQPGDYVTATFRLAIPGSIPDTIPEPGAGLLGLLGAWGLFKRRRR